MPGQCQSQLLQNITFILELACILKYFNFNICKIVKYKVIKSCKNPNVFKNITKTRKLFELKNICTFTGVLSCVWLADTSSAPAGNYIPIYWEYFSFYFRTVTTIQLYIVRVIPGEILRFTSFFLNNSALYWLWNRDRNDYDMKI